MLNQEESEQLEESERRIGQRLGRGVRHPLGYGRRRHWFRDALYATWYVLLTAAAVSAVYHLLAT